MSRQNLPAPPLPPRPETAEPASPSGPELAPGMLALAHRLQRVLKPVEPRAAFLAQLTQQLTAARPQAQAAARQREQRLMWVAGIGGALYLAGLGFVSLRAAKAGGGRLASVVAARGTRRVEAPTAT